MATAFFIIEEHHEAFIVWDYAIRKGWMQPCDNCLIHVDEHSDLGTPRFNTSIRNNKSRKDVIDFTYTELNIASFIIPACYLGIFNNVCWVRYKHRKLKQNSHKLYVRSYNQNGKRLISGKETDIISSQNDTERKVFDYSLLEVDQLPDQKEIILDIDLDYFSCSGNPNEQEELYIQITKTEYDTFTTNKYHRLNYINVGRLEALQKDGEYYYVLNNYKEIYPCDCYVSKDEIVRRIDKFCETLKIKKLIPSIISICRSRYSGYTPHDQWKFIENHLVTRLQELYSLEDHTPELPCH